MTPKVFVRKGDQRCSMVADLSVPRVARLPKRAVSESQRSVSGTGGG